MMNLWAWAAPLTKYAVEGVETYLICATRGERGWTGDEKDNPGLMALGEIRERELRCAARTLSVFANDIF